MTTSKALLMPTILLIRTTKTTAIIAEKNAQKSFAINNVKKHMKMTKGYEIYNGLHHEKQIIFVVSNYPILNKVVTRGFMKMPNIHETDIGFWKIKKLKV